MYFWCNHLLAVHWSEMKSCGDILLLCQWYGCCNQGKSCPPERAFWFAGGKVSLLKPVSYLIVLTIWCSCLLELPLALFSNYKRHYLLFRFARSELFVETWMTFVCDHFGEDLAGHCNECFSGEAVELFHDLYKGHCCILFPRTSHFSNHAILFRGFCIFPRTSFLELCDHVLRFLPIIPRSFRACCSSLVSHCDPS